MCKSYHISRFVCWSVVTGGCVFSAVLLNSCQKNNNGRLPLQIDNIDLTQHFSLSIFTDFCYQSINITWLLPIFIDWLLRVSSDLQLYVVDRTIWLLYNWDLKIPEMFLKGLFHYYFCCKTFPWHTQLYLQQKTTSAWQHASRGIFDKMLQCSF